MCSGRHGCEPIIERSGDKVNLSDSVNVVEDSYQNGDTLYGWLSSRTTDATSQLTGT